MSAKAESWTKKGKYSSLKKTSRKNKKLVKEYENLKEQELEINGKLSSLIDLDLDNYEIEDYRELLLSRRSELLSYIKYNESKLDSIALSEVIYKITSESPKRMSYFHTDVFGGGVKVNNPVKRIGSTMFLTGIFISAVTFVLSFISYGGSDKTSEMLGTYVFILSPIFMVSIMLGGFLFKGPGKDIKEEYFYSEQWDRLNKPHVVLEYISLKKKYSECVTLSGILSNLGASELDVLEVDNAISDRRVVIENKKKEIDRETSDKIALD